MKCTSCNATVSPVVGLDIDGTLGQYHKHFIEFCRHYFGQAFFGFGLDRWDGYGEFSDALGLDKPQYREAKLAYRQGGWKRWMPAYPYAVELVRHLQGQGVEVWLCTTRPWLRLDNIDPDTRHWCQRNGISFDGMLFGEDKYSQLIERVGLERIVAIVDDEPGQIYKVSQMRIPYIWRRHNFNFELNLHPVEDSLVTLEAVLRQEVSDWREHNG